ncbi:hypothetical protein ACFWVB_38225 [Streptomyces microflavus]|uniref:hypothetical protein n=1 Tax=Streptomyces microflavus TaxID=1919 RepID=UPI00366996AB
MSATTATAAPFTISAEDLTIITPYFLTQIAAQPEGVDILTEVTSRAATDPTADIDLTAGELVQLLDRLRPMLAAQPKKDANGPHCQTLGSLFHMASDSHGTEPTTSEHCICNG